MARLRIPFCGSWILTTFLSVTLERYVIVPLFPESQSLSNTEWDDCPTALIGAPLTRHSRVGSIWPSGEECCDCWSGVNGSGEGPVPLSRTLSTALLPPLTPTEPHRRWGTSWMSFQHLYLESQISDLRLSASSLCRNGITFHQDDP